MALSEWVKITKSNLKAEAEDNFMRKYVIAELDEQISTNNYLNGLVWDTALDVPGEPRRALLALALPELKGFRQIISKRYNRLKN